MENNEGKPKKENVADALKKYKHVINSNKEVAGAPNPVGTDIPRPPAFNAQEFERTMSRETDPDLMTSYEIIKLPSKGLFYQSRIGEVNVEYMTSKEEDLLTTPSLIESGNVLDFLLRRKIKTSGITPEELLPGDRNAIILFLRTSSYGADYSVQVTDPRSGIPFKSSIDLLKLKYKEPKEQPDDFGHFTVELPMRKKTATIRLLSSGEESIIFKKAEAMREAYSQDFSEFNTLKLKANVVAVNEKTDRSYIDKFVDAMPAGDALKIRKKILDVSPDVDMDYEFMCKDGYKFHANLTVGIDFFFPGT